MMKANANSLITLVVHWTRFGPHHLARLRTAFHELKPVGIRIVGMEMTSQADRYAWEQDNDPTDFDRRVVLPGKIFEHVSATDKWRGVISMLDDINPDAVAVNGYSYYDAWSALTWCKLHRRPAILMSDSKSDDAPRVAWRERFKGMIVRRFDSALCAGRPQRSYLEQLGMKSERIFFGLDAVDNGYFWRGADQARRNVDAFCSFPGLETREPFFLASARFVKGKNLDGLLRAYAQYRRRVGETSTGQSPWRLVILGNGVEWDALHHLVNSEGIQGVSFAGFCQIRALPAYYGLASVFIHPSYQDTWGLVVNEAMAAGLPVLVSTRSGCATDLVAEGENGFTFQPEDLETLTGLMLRVSSGQVDLRSMGEASRRRIGEWGPTRFAQGLGEAVRIAMQRP